MKAHEGEIWIMWHVPPGGDADKAMLIGAYSSRQAALAAIVRLRDKPGFRDHPSVTDDENGPGFFIQSYAIDADHWADGYRIARDGEDWQPLPAWLPPWVDE
jgi:hypothetical protein